MSEIRRKEGYRYFTVEGLRRLGIDLYEKYGLSREDAALALDVILTSDQMGIESHGVNRLTMYTDNFELGRVHVDAKPEIVYETPVSAVIDANECMGHVAGVLGMRTAIEKAKKTGIAMVNVRNSNHFGIAGYYSLRACNEGMIGISMTNAEATVVPTFSRKPMMGTNPIAVSVPADPYPWHMDFATSIITNGKCEVYAKTGHALPDGVLIDRDGKPCNDPNTFLEIRRNKTLGGLAPLGGLGEGLSGYKGYGFSFLVDILSAVMSGGCVSNQCRAVKNQDRVCHFFAAIDPAIWGDPQTIRARLSQEMEKLRNAPLADGAERIYVHGDKEVEAQEFVRKNGVGINEATLRDIRQRCEKFGMLLEDYLDEVSEE